MAQDKSGDFCLDLTKRKQIIALTQLLIVPRGLSAGKTVFETLAGFQWLFIFATLTVVYRKAPDLRRYETAVLEICRKNGKTFLIAVIFIILFFTEPKFSKFYSVAVDLSETIDNTAVAIVALDDDKETILAHVMGFIPTDSIESKSLNEKVPYSEWIERGWCIDCGDRVIDYSVVEEYVFMLEQKFGCKVVAIGYDRWNALSSAQKWDAVYETVEIKQHSRVLHSPTKLLRDKILQHKFRYNEDRMLEINFQNARCNYDSNRNMYVNKKRSAGKIDKVVALINAISLLEKYELEAADMSWGVMM